MVVTLEKIFTDNNHQHTRQQNELPQKRHKDYNNSFKMNTSISFRKIIKKKRKTYNSRDSLVVTHPTTNRPACGLSTAERTGSPVFHTLWSYVLVLHVAWYLTTSYISSPSTLRGYSRKMADLGHSMHQQLCTQYNGQVLRINRTIPLLRRNNLFSYGPNASSIMTVLGGASSPGPT